MCLQQAYRANRKYEAVLRDFESLIFPQDEAKGVQLLAEIRSAMADVDSLVASGGKHMTRAREWLSKIGADESNPARLSMLACAFMDDIAVMGKSLAKMAPT